MQKGYSFPNVIDIQRVLDKLQASFTILCWNGPALLSFLNMHFLVYLFLIDKFSIFKTCTSLEDIHFADSVVVTAQTHDSK